jgi:hypothetical protein
VLNRERLEDLAQSVLITLLENNGNEPILIPQDGPHPDDVMVDRSIRMAKAVLERCEEVCPTNEAAIGFKGNGAAVSGKKKRDE